MELLLDGNRWQGKEREHSADEILHHIPTFRCPFGSRLLFIVCVRVCVCVPFLLASVGRKLTLVAIDPKSARVVETNGG